MLLFLSETLAGIWWWTQLKSIEQMFGGHIRTQYEMNDKVGKMKNPINVEAAQMPLLSAAIVLVILHRMFPSGPPLPRFGGLFVQAAAFGLCVLLDDICEGKRRKDMIRWVTIILYCWTYITGWSCWFG